MNDVDRVILGTIAVREPDFVRRACVEYPGRIAVGIDAKGGRVAVEGWAETSELTAEELAKRFEDAGVSAIIYTDIERDGVLKGLNLPATADLARATSIPVIASGGAGRAGLVLGQGPGRVVVSGGEDRPWPGSSSPTRYPPRSIPT